MVVFVALLCLVPIIVLAAGVGSLTPGGWEERYLRLLANAFGEPLPDGIRPLTGKLCGELLCEFEKRDDFKQVISDRYVRGIYDRLGKRFEYEKKIAKQGKNGKFDYSVKWIDAALVELGGRDRSGKFRIPDYEDPEHPSAVFGGIRLDHGIALEDIFAFEVAESATGQWMPQNNSETTDGRVFVEKLHATVVYYNVMLDIGRDRLAWGYGRRGDFILSDNAGPYDAIKLGAHHPFKFPWVFKWLGAWHPTIFVSQIRGNRKDFDHPFLFGGRLSWAPLPWPYLEGSVSRTFMVLGEGRPGMSAEDWGNVLIGREEHTYGGASDSNGIFKVDVRLHFGFLKRWIKIGSFSAWYQHGADSFSRDLSEAYVRGNAFGFEYDQTRFGIWGEWADTLTSNVEWYSHYVYTDGYTQEGKIIGRATGAFAQEYTLGTWLFATPNVQLSAQGELINHMGKKHRTADRRVGGDLGIEFFFDYGLRLELTGHYAQTYEENIDAPTNDVSVKALLGWSNILF